VSSCSDEETTWEDSQNKGKSMTTKLIQILRKNPSVKVGELNQQLKKKLSKMAFKRVMKAKTTFKKYSAKLSPEAQKQWEDKYTKKGLFQLREQTAQIGSLHRLCRDDVLIAKRTCTSGSDVVTSSFP
jgi:phage host-nuclease inhibitor protein Gam